jgi:ribonuclease HI
MKTKDQNPNTVARIFADGSGCRPDGKGSSFAWLREDTGEKKITPKDSLTNNQAEYHAIFSALESLSPGSRAEILTDSENTCFQLRGERRVRDPHLAELNKQISDLIQKNGLDITFTWIPRRENKAGKLI